MSNSPLVNYTKISPNKTSPRNHKIDTITIHVYVGQVSVERIGSGFASRLKNASCNYGIGYDGKIALIVEEKDRSWCSSNKENDHRAITIEVASETMAPYRVSDAAFHSLIDLCADICKRNNIEKLVWSTDRNARVKHLNGCNMTVHRDFANKSCPGDYLYKLHGEIARLVNEKLGMDYSLVFDPAYYANKYPDLKKAFGTDSAKLFEHFRTYGMKEGRQATSTFDVTAYKSRYADLRNAFGNYLPDFYKHYMQFGYKEKRIGI